MVKRLLPFIVLLSMLFMTAPVFAADTPTLYEKLITGWDAQTDNISGNTWAYQQFTVGSVSHTATQISIYIRRVGDPSTVTVSLRTAAAGIPTGNDLAVATFDGGAISTSYTEYPFPIAETSLAAGAQYAIVVRAIAGDATNFIQWGIDGVAGGLADAIYGHSTDGGLIFASTAGDALFEIWGYPCIDVIGAKVFTGYMETDDWLIIADTKNMYPPYYPNGDPQVYFQLQLLDGAVIKASTNVRAWDRQPLAIYLNQATAATLSWGDNMTVVMQLLGTATVYESYTLQITDWTSGSLYFLDGYVRSLAGIYEDYYAATYLELTSDKGNVLNDAGGAIFDRGITNLSTVRPNLFKTAYQTLSHTPGSFTKAGETAVIWSDRTGTLIANFLITAGTLFGGVGGKDMGGMILILLWFIGALSAGTGHFTGGAIASIFFVGIGMLFGMIPWVLILCVAALGIPFLVGWYINRTVSE